MPAPQSAKDLLALNLAVAYYPGPGQETEGWRELFRRRQNLGTLKWNIHVFETAAHMAALVGESRWDILYMHWHGESGTNIDLPGEIAKRYRTSHAASPRPDPTFLVGGCTPGDGRFADHNRVEALLKIYDMLIYRPVFVDDFQNIAAGWWNMRHASSPELMMPFTGLGVFVSKQTQPT